MSLATNELDSAVFMYTPHTPRDVHKKNPGRGRMGEPEPTGAFYSHGRTSRGPVQCRWGAKRRPRCL